MGVILAALAGSTAGLGLLVFALGAQRVHRSSTALPTGLWIKLGRWWTGLSSARRGWFGGALVTGLVAGVASASVIGLVLLPTALVAIPLLLSAPPNREVEVLAGLDRWVRLISTSLSSGKSIRDAIFATRSQVPAVLREPVAHLCTRLDQRWHTRDALFAMADELGSADADAVVAALAIAAAKGGAGARVTLGAVSDSIQARLAALREIAAERSKPRVVVKQVTLITLGVLGGALVLNPQFFIPYTTPLGQVIAFALAGAYLGCLVMVRRMTVPPLAPRFLRSAA
ncbi:type II secretion system F family protein [Tessaracoccus sp. Z1128]